jgi:Histidine kinase-, DNA gyrase B-, and HSP90-like ATPase.
LIERFTVDAALLRELGERLIGRPHIAIAELVKNAYDADAFTCELTITGDVIEVADNGHGMTLEQFRLFYLRLASQNKREREKSPRLKRPLTGSKGVGRLAAQFLGRRLKIYSAHEDDPEHALVARVNWNRINPGEDLADFRVIVRKVPRAMVPDFPEESCFGTRIRIEQLWEPVNAEAIADLGREVWSLRSPFRVAARGAEPRDWRSFDVVLQSDRPLAQELFDDILHELTESVWRARITGRVRNGRSTGIAEIEIEFRSNYPTNAPARVYRDQLHLSSLRSADTEAEAGRVSEKPLIDHVDFTIHVFRLERMQPKRVPLPALRDYLGRFGSVSVYDAGFRLPYYGIENDWLKNGADHARRLSTSELLPSKWNIDARYMLDLPEPRRIFGWVEIDTNHEARKWDRVNPAEYLQIQAGRDRLVGNTAYNQLAALVRYSLDLYANRYRARLIKAQEASEDTEPARRKYSRIREILSENKDVIPVQVRKDLEALAMSAERSAAASEKLFDARTVALAPLAAAGLAALGLTHELARESRLLERTRRRLEQMARKHNLPELTEAAEELGSSLQRLRSLQGLFAPLLTEEDREGDNRLRVKPIALQVADSMRPLTPGMKIDVNVDEDLRFPPAPLAAWSAVLQNVIANSWNASLGTEEAVVFIEGGSNAREEWIWISDKGVGVELGGSDRLFDAFERALEVAPEHSGVVIGGQGMGLAIVRLLCNKYGCDVAFVEPEDGFATTLQISWKA